MGGCGDDLRVRCSENIGVGRQTKKAHVEFCVLAVYFFGRYYHRSVNR
jgi:hypothetical protein